MRHIQPPTLNSPKGFEILFLGHECDHNDRKWILSPETRTFCITMLIGPIETYPTSAPQIYIERW